MTALPAEKRIYSSALFPTLYLITWLLLFIIGIAGIFAWYLDSGAAPEDRASLPVGLTLTLFSGVMIYLWSQVLGWTIRHVPLLILRNNDLFCKYGGLFCRNRTLLWQQVIGIDFYSPIGQGYPLVNTLFIRISYRDNPISAQKASKKAPKRKTLMIPTRWLKGDPQVILDTVRDYWRFNNSDAECICQFYERTESRRGKFTAFWEALIIVAIAVAILSLKYLSQWLR